MRAKSICGGFLLVVLLLSEPFLAQGSQKMEIRLPPAYGGRADRQRDSQANR